MVQGTFTGYFTSWDETDISFYASSSLDGGLGNTPNTRGYINLTRGAEAESWIYYNFDTSEIPGNAVVTSIQCTLKAYISTTATNRVQTRQACLYSGTSQKGSPYTLTTSTTAFNLTPGTWTRNDLSNIRVRFYAKRSTNSGQANSSTYIYIYNGTLTIDYEYEPVFYKVNGTWKPVSNMYRKENNVWVKQTNFSQLISQNKAYVDKDRELIH